jgi:2-polyprenyl-3-methyl-5-hydroxy-6-metoxy-1,4-benzoquinol methylase
METGINMKKRFIKAMAKILCIFPSSIFGDVIGKAAIYKTRRMNPREGLKLLFSIDSLLYSAQGRLAISYGDGLHTKHKHTGYHDFFTSRIKEAERVLDVGCGNGALACDIATKSGAIVDGIDINEKNIEQARVKHSHPKVGYYVGDATKDLGTEQYDVVVLSNVLEHLSDRVSFLQKLLATTRPNRILIRVPLFERDWRVPLRKEVGEEWRLDPTHETEYTQEQFILETKAAGLEVDYFEVRWGEIWAGLSAFENEIS